MSEATARKLNIPEETTYIFMPLDFLRLPTFAGYPIIAKLMLGVIYTLNRISQKKWKRPAKIKYADFVDRLGMSRETVANYKQSFIDKGIIEYLGKSQYKILAEFSEKDYIKVDDYLHNTVWEMEPYEPGKRKRQRKEQKKLTRSATVILAFLERMNSDPEKKGIFTSSQARIGVALNIARTTAGDGVREIIAASLCDTEPAPGSLTKYTVKPELLNVKRRAPQVEKSDEQEPKQAEPKKPAKPKKLSKREQVEKELQAAAINRKILNHFAELRHKAEERAERAERKALSDKVYQELKERQSAINIDLGKAEAYDDKAKVEQLSKEAAKLEEQMNERLKALGIDKRELTPQYQCKHCNDTGYDSGGNQCSCLKKFIENIEI